MQRQSTYATGYATRHWCNPGGVETLPNLFNRRFGPTPQIAPGCCPWRYYGIAIGTTALSRCPFGNLEIEPDDSRM